MKDCCRCAGKCWHGSGEGYHLWCDKHHPWGPGQVVMILELLKRALCILDIVQWGDARFTCRFCEARKMDGHTEHCRITELCRDVKKEMEGS